MIRCTRQHWERMVARRGYTLEQVAACIVGDDGDRLTVDETHPSYPRSPTLAQQTANFAAAAVRHVAAGLPRCTDEQVAARFAICQGCEHYDGRACTECGCPIMRERQFLSKLSWAGESCPAGKWGPASS